MKFDYMKMEINNVSRNNHTQNKRKGGGGIK